jgi:hypothetical protein
MGRFLARPERADRRESFMQAGTPWARQAAGSMPGERPARRWAPLAGVLAVLAAVVFGGPVAEQVLEEPAGPPIQLTRGVSIQPLPGWRADTSAVSGGLLLTRGSGNLIVLPALRETGGPTELCYWYLDETLAPDARGLVSSDPEPVHVGAGRLPAVRVSYEGEFLAGRTNPVVGEITAALAPDGTAVVLDSWGSQDSFQYQQADVQRMIDTVEVR